MKPKSPRVLLLNPWITDFAAYNCWVRPLGLLRIGAFLRQRGICIDLIDCLDFNTTKREYGDGKFLKTRIEKPIAVRSIPRNYSRYGITEEMLVERFSSVQRPDLIAITSGMTYWYPGLFNTIKMAKAVFSSIPIILGGVYATFCYDHAVEFSGADIVIRGHGELEILNLISSIHPELRISHSEIRDGSPPYPPYPCFDLYPTLDSVCISTTKGCPFKCTYCGSRFLSEGFSKTDPFEVVKEIEYWATLYQVRNFAFYDDALLVDPSSHIIPLIKEVLRRNLLCNFHTPNGLHTREISEEVADLLFRSRFRTIRLGLETSNEAEQERTGGKVTNQHFKSAVKNLKKAGYSGQQIGAYILAGLPNQPAEEIEESVKYALEVGAKPVLVEYSPVPNTPLFDKAKKTSVFDLEHEPLFHNNSILPCQWEGFTVADYKRLKELIGKGIKS